MWKLAIILLISAVASADVVIHVDVAQAGKPVSRHLTGACIEDVNHEVYGGIYSQMIFGESFQEPPPSPAIAAFSEFGGSWSARDGVLHLDAADGPKLVSNHPSVGDGAAGVELLFSGGEG